MEISALTSFITPFLPFLLKLDRDATEAATETATEAATDNAVSKFGDAAWQKAQAVWTALKPRVDEKETLKEAVTDVAHDPEDEDYQAALRVQLKKLLASDTALTAQLTKILQSANSNNWPTTQITQTVTGNQNQTIGQLSGGQVFGNVTGSIIISGSGNSVTSTSANATPAPLHTTQPAVPKVPASSVKTILVLAANPKGTNPLRLGEEVREIQEGLDRSKYRDRFRIEQRWAVTPKDIRRALLDCNPQIVHFSGHGVGVAKFDESSTSGRDIGFVSERTTEPEGLLFEDEIGHSKLVSTEAIARLFSLFSDEIECVVLNACYSATQAEAITQHIPFVVGMKQAIGDRAAIAFTLGFYDALLAGRSVAFAYQLGCNAIELQGIPEHLTPVLKR
ncbi:MAG: CHAT domain-containing protein [Phormidesmis sp.]